MMGKNCGPGGLPGEDNLDLDLDLEGDVGGEPSDAPLDLGGEGDVGLEGGDDLGGLDDLGGEDDSVTCSRSVLRDVIERAIAGELGVDEAVEEVAGGGAGDELGGEDMPPLEGEDEGGLDGLDDLGGGDDGLDMGGDDEMDSDLAMESRVKTIAGLITEDPDVFYKMKKNRKPRK